MKMITSFFLLLIFSISVFCQVEDSKQNPKKKAEKTESGKQSEDQNVETAGGSGRSTGSGISDSHENIVRDKNAGVRILSKPQPLYTDKARENNTEGKVILEIEFKKDGNIGKVKVVTGLPDGLNEKAIDAAKKIRFLPELKDGNPKSVKKKFQFTFKLF